MRFSLTALLYILFSSIAFTQNVVFTEVSDNLSTSHIYGYLSEMGGGVSFVDFNQDGWDDITLGTDEGDGIYFYQNDGTGNFFKTNLGGIFTTGRQKHLLWSDVDNDGDYDLFSGENETGNHLYLNNGLMQFTDVTEGSGLDSLHIDNNSFGSSFADFNKDGNLDLYVTNRTIGGVYLPNGNIMYYGNGDGTFTNVTDETNSKDVNQAPLAVCAFDYDLDGYDDLYIGQDKNFGNTMLHSLGGELFESVAEETQTDYVMDGMNCEVGDMDNNGFLDIYVTDVYGGSILLMNNGNGSFVNEAETRGCAMVGDFGWGGSFVDIDNDLDLDIYVSNSTLGQPRANRLFVNDGTGNFLQAGIEYGFENDSLRSFGNMFGDINNDGFPDIATNNFADESDLWLNSGNENTWLKYKLTGTASNRDADGAFVYFYVDGDSFMRSHHAGQGFLSQQSYTKIFGFGEHEQVDSINVVWPSGFSEWHYNLLPEENYEFTEGETYSFEISSSLGVDLCGGTETMLEIIGDFDSVIWNDSLDQDQLFASASGYYTALVTNEFGVSSFDSLQINIVNEDLAVDIISGLAICPNEFLADVNVMVTSDFPYTIYWDDVEGGEVASVDIGMHQIEVIDSVGCSILEDFEITTTEELNINGITVDVSCFEEEDGQLILELNGADPFSILINEEKASIFSNNLSEGTYEVLVTDANGCQVNEEFELVSPEEVIYEVITEPDFGNSEGTISIINISGGTAPYYLDEGEIFTFSDLGQGIYDFELCDSNECCTNIEAEVEFQIGVENQLPEGVSYLFDHESGILEINGIKELADSKFVVLDASGRKIEGAENIQNGTRVLFDFSAHVSGVYIIKHSHYQLVIKIFKI